MQLLQAFQGLDLFISNMSICLCCICVSKYVLILIFMFHDVLLVDYQLSTYNSHLFNTSWIYIVDIHYTHTYIYIHTYNFIVYIYIHTFHEHINISSRLLMLRDIYQYSLCIYIYIHTCVCVTLYTVFIRPGAVCCPEGSNGF